MTPFQGPERALYEEALRVVPAMAATRVRGDENDGMMLMQGYMRTASEHGIPRTSAWAILYSASQVQIAALVDFAAKVSDEEPATITERMVAAAVEAVATGAI